MKQLKELTFDELVNEAMARIHLAMLNEGAKGMKSAIWISMSIAIDWRKQKDVEDL